MRVVLSGTLEKGFSTDDLQLGAIERQFQDRLIMRIDKTRLGNQEILERRELIERLRQKQLSVDELGFELLKKHLEELDYKNLNSAEALLEKLAEGNVEKVRKLVIQENV